MPRRPVLSQIPGQYIVDAMDRLPAAGPEAGAHYVDIEAGPWGRFRVTFKPFRPAAGHVSHTWFWIAESAEYLVEK
jgi:hypothetical protein